MFDVHRHDPKSSLDFYPPFLLNDIEVIDPLCVTEIKFVLRFFFYVPQDGKGDVSTGYTN